MSVLVMKASRDPHFKDPIAESAWGAGKRRAQITFIKEDAHGTQVEAQDQVEDEIESFVNQKKRK